MSVVGLRGITTLAAAALCAGLASPVRAGDVGQTCLYLCPAHARDCDDDARRLVCRTSPVVSSAAELEAELPLLAPVGKRLSDVQAHLLELGFSCMHLFPWPDNMTSCDRIVSRPHCRQQQQELRVTLLDPATASEPAIWLSGDWRADDKRREALPVASVKVMLFEQDDPDCRGGR